MAFGRRDIDMTPLDFFSVLRKSGRQPPHLGENSVKRGLELAGKVDDRENGSRKIVGKFAGEKTQSVEASRGSADSENVAMHHASTTCRGGVSSTANSTGQRSTGLSQTFVGG